MKKSERDWINVVGAADSTFGGGARDGFAARAFDAYLGRVLRASSQFPSEQLFKPETSDVFATVWIFYVQRLKWRMPPLKTLN